MQFATLRARKLVEMKFADLRVRKLVGVEVAALQWTLVDTELAALRMRHAG